jgi:DNA polymerase III gamma/tau subunit
VTALYRKYRPQGFDEVVGQEAVVRTLRNAIEHDQVRQAYLFAGVMGVRGVAPNTDRSGPLAPRQP